MLMPFLFLTLLVAHTVNAAPPHASSRLSYDHALQAAQSKVTRMAEATSSRAGAQSSLPLNRLYGRLYNVGDTWQVTAWRINRAQEMFAAPVPASQKYDNTPLAEKGTFQYRVTKTRWGQNPEFDIEILQNVDPKIEKVLLTVDAGLHVIRKAYKTFSREAPLAVSPEGVHSAMTILELFPLAPPELLSANLTQGKTLPLLPQTIPAPVRANEKGTWIEQDDFFGRPIEALWVAGNPWPSYLRTNNGIAIFEKRGAQ